MKARFTTMRKHPSKPNTYIVFNKVFNYVPPFVGNLEQCQRERLAAEKKGLSLVNQSRNEVIAEVGKAFVEKVEEMPINAASFIRRGDEKVYLKTVNASDNGDMVGELRIYYMKNDDGYFPIKYEYEENND